MESLLKVVAGRGSGYTQLVRRTTLTSPFKIEKEAYLPCCDPN
jgi:hypothetical protein